MKLRRRSEVSERKNERDSFMEKELARKNSGQKLAGESNKWLRPKRQLPSFQSFSKLPKLNLKSPSELRLMFGTR